MPTASLEDLIAVFRPVMPIGSRWCQPMLIVERPCTIDPPSQAKALGLVSREHLLAGDRVLALTMGREPVWRYVSARESAKLVGSKIRQDRDAVAEYQIPLREQGIDDWEACLAGCRSPFLACAEVLLAQCHRCGHYCEPSILFDGPPGVEQPSEGKDLELYSVCTVCADGQGRDA